MPISSLGLFKVPFTSQSLSSGITISQRGPLDCATSAIGVADPDPSGATSNGADPESSGATSIVADPGPLVFRATSIGADPGSIWSLGARGGSVEEPGLGVDKSREELIGEAGTCGRLTGIRGGSVEDKHENIDCHVHGREAPHPRARACKSSRTVRRVCHKSNKVRR